MGGSHAGAPGRGVVFWRRLALALALFVVADRHWAWSSPDDAAAGAGGEPAASPGARALGGGGGDEAHSYDAMYFLVLCICCGAGVSSVAMKLHWIQQTVGLFVLGWLFSLVMRQAADSLGGVGNSYTMWMVIDPHLLLFTMLPPLLAEEAMMIDTHVAESVAKQCVYMAGPGMILSAFVTAFFLQAYLPYDWDFELCLSVGGILCATDPVAVVSLLKELGASPTLTMQIQGESLLNDGSAMVLFTVAYQMLAGETWDFGDVSLFMLTNTLFAWIFGMSVGAVFYGWLRLVKNKFDHNAGMLQVALTILCAYSSFGIAEGILHVNGVLATVASSLFLARFMWPQIVDEHSLHMVWDMFGYLGNSVVFFLAGALVGNAMLSDVIVLRDYLDLLLIYLFISLVRLGIVFASRPLLRVLSYGGDKAVTWQQAVLISHAGLRGAVGLALAVHVHHDRAAKSDGTPTISTNDADRVLFYVGGVALLTMVVNAPTSPVLVRKLKLSSTPAIRQQVMICLHGRLQNKVSSGDARHTAEVKDSLGEMLDEVLHHVQPRPVAAMHRVTVTMQKMTRSRSSLDGTAKPISLKRSGIAWECTRVDDLLDDLEEQERDFDNLCQRSDSAKRARTRVDGILPTSHGEDHMKELRGKMFSKEFEVNLAIAINKALLHIVEAQYWHQLEASSILSGEFELLNDSVVYALSHPRMDKHDNPDIGDFRELLRNVNCLEELKTQVTRRRSMLWAAATLDDASRHRTSRPNLDRPMTYELVTSKWFQVSVYALVLANIAFIVTEQYGGDIMSSEGWFALDIVFCVGFTIEAKLNLFAFRRAYFDDPWNWFDFILVIVGWIGAALNCAQLISGESVQTSQSQVGRIVKFMKALRLLRFLRLVRMTQRLRATLTGKASEQVISSQVQEHLKSFALLQAFIKAHTSAQEELLNFFGKNVKRDSQAATGQHYEIDIPEVATCLLQSKIAVTRARKFAAMVWAALHPGDVEDMWCLQEEQECYIEMDITRTLINYVHKAERLGAVSAAEAEALIDPMHEHYGTWAARAESLRSGQAVCPEPAGGHDAAAAQAAAPRGGRSGTPGRAGQPAAQGRRGHATAAPSLLQRCFGKSRPVQETE